MRALFITDLFANSLRELALRSSDPALLINSVYGAASQVAAGRPPAWADDHPLQGAYRAYRSFKPISEQPDLMVIYSVRARSLILADMGVHARFFTKGRKTKPVKSDRLKPHGSEEQA